MTFHEFLDLVKVIRMLYGVKNATYFFEKNIDLYYDLDSHRLNNIKKEV